MIQLKNVTKTYHYKKANAFEALHHVSLEISEGEMIAIIGTSGSGKSTLLHILGCVDSFENGSYFLNGTDLSRISEVKASAIRNEKIGIVEQNFALIENFSALENVLLPFYFDKKTKLSEAKKRAISVLDQMEMTYLQHKPVNQLSGGQKQRIAIARAIVKRPDLILADEPTGALDSKTSAEIMQIFHSLHEAGNTVVIVTHDPNIASQCERVIRIEDGRVLNQ